MSVAQCDEDSEWDDADIIQDENGLWYNELPGSVVLWGTVYIAMMAMKE